MSGKSDILKTMVKHFFKTLFIFTIIVIFGLVGVYLVMYFDGGGEFMETLNNKIGFAK
ncbi:MAG: hypothetical protein UU10_C0016G0004 [Parcubacteria group bacterium GW2011_GWF1_40_6]|nr:MAG: hypothetical protein UU10_C0016G0004 [Parcubacteria group bacterium GW2011_GWF1_40_6]